jgi:aldehyde:ferredoxin oxidoreductase
MSFEDSMEIGRKIFTLNRAIWALQGRHRDMEKFADYIYDIPSEGIVMVAGRSPSYFMPVRENGQWDYKNVVPRNLNRDRVEEWKSIFYELEGWDVNTGNPLKSTLEAMGLQSVINVLQENDKL